MDPYSLVTSADGLLVLAGIVFTWHLTRLVERNRLGREKLSWLILAGGLLTALGFTGYAAGLDFALMVVVGPVLIACALSMSGLVGARLEMLVQIGLMLLSICASRNPRTSTIRMFSDVSLLLLMDAVAFYSSSPKKPASMARLSAWLLVAFTVVNSVSYRSLPALLLYTASVSIWMVALLLSYPRAKLLKSAQKGL
ncbi:MAG: hypothetical protein GXO14_00345 [Thermococci archaeon]|nr:hypothetical protein [Thermococci archaeon]